MNQNDMPAYRARVWDEIRKRMDDPGDGLGKELAVIKRQAAIWRDALRFDWAEQVEKALGDYENEPTPVNAETLLYVYRWCAKAEAEEGTR